MDETNLELVKDWLTRAHQDFKMDFRVFRVVRG
jgi:hypothetical protein